MVKEGAVTITRVIEFSQSIPQPTKRDSLRVLVISARPTGSEGLSTSDREAIEEGVRIAGAENRVVVETLSPTSFEALQQRLWSDIFHVIHFDGHGAYGRVCPECQALTQEWQARKCNQCDRPLPEKPQGYLTFGATNSKPEYVSAKQFASLLLHAQQQVARQRSLAEKFAWLCSTCAGRLRLWMTTPATAQSSAVWPRD